jgi:hypothetical protein
MSTYRELMDAASACTTKEEADTLLAKEIDKLMLADPHILHEQARAAVLTNVGYLSGYFDRATAGRILELFETRHPYFGAIEDWPKTPEETIALGVKAGMQAKR